MNQTTLPTPLRSPIVRMPQPDLAHWLIRGLLWLSMLLFFGQPLLCEWLPPMLLSHPLAGLLTEAIRLASLIGLLLLLLDLLSALVTLIAAQRAHMRHAPPTSFQILLPKAFAAPTVAQPDRTAFLRALHAHIPAETALHLWIRASQGRPAELGITLTGSAAQQRQALDHVRAALSALHPHAQLIAVSETATIQPDQRIWHRYTVALPSHYPLQQSFPDQVLANILAALPPRGHASQHEIRYTIQPIRGPLAWVLLHGWRGRAQALRLRLEARLLPALPGDSQAIATKLSHPCYWVTIQLCASGSASQQQLSASLQPVAAAMVTSQQAIAGRCQHLRLVRHGVGGYPPVLPAHPPRIMLLWPFWRDPAILAISELAQFWNLPEAIHRGLIQHTPCVVLPAPVYAFAPAEEPERIRLGTAMHTNGQHMPVGPTLRDLRQILHLTAGMGAGKSRLLANICQQLIPHGFVLIDGKGDDRGGSLVQSVQHLIPQAEERRMVILDPLDQAWPIGINPLSTGSASPDLALGQVLALLARLDPETWGHAPGMQQLAQMATLLVLAGQPCPTIAHIRHALLNEAYRERLLQHPQDSEVRRFWQELFPSLSEAQRSSRDALLRRFDLILTAEITRLMLTQAQPLFEFRQAIAQGWIVLIPLPDLSLGGLAGAVGMLLFQSFVRAAFQRSGSDSERHNYTLIIDEVQVLLGKSDGRDLETAITRLRSLGIPAIYAHQALAQLGDLRDLMLINAANRVILQTQEPDASIYARQYASAQLTAQDIAAQPPETHQYATLRCHGQPTGVFSMQPLPWPTPTTTVPSAAAPALDWRTILPAQQDPVDPLILELIYGELDDISAQHALASLCQHDWQRLNDRWDAIRQAQRRFLLRHPEAIPDRNERQRWLSRLLVARPRILAMLEHTRMNEPSSYVTVTESSTVF
jgi:hypothetical protein